MEKGVGIVTKWDNAPGFVGSYPYEAFGLTSSGYRAFDRLPNNIDFIPNGYGGILERCDHGQYYQAYRDCAPLQAVINKIAQGHANGVPWVLNTQGKAKGKVSQSEQAVKIRALVDKPNPLQTQDEFEAQAKIYQKIFGYNIVFIFKGVGSENYEAQEMWNIPASMLTITEKRRSFIYQSDSPFESIVLNYAGFTIPLPVANCYIQKDFTPSFDTVILPESRIRALSPQIHNIIAAYASRGTLIVNRGPGNIISGAGKSDQFGSALTPQDVDDVQSKMLMYGNMPRQFRDIVTHAAMNVQALGRPTKELMLFEEIEDDIMRICDAYGVNFRLLSSSRSNSLGGSDADIFDKQFYQNTIIPESRRDCAFWNKVFNCEAYGITIDDDFSHLPVLQEDKVNLGKARRELGAAYLLQWEAGSVTLNEWRIALGDDPIGEVQFDMYKPQYGKWLSDNGFAPQEALKPTEAAEIANEEDDGSTTQP